MKFKLQSYARTLTWALIALSVVSALYGKQWAEQARQEEAKLKKAKAELADISTVQRKITPKTNSAPEQPALKMNDALATTITQLMEKRNQFGISLDQVSPATPVTGDSNKLSMADLATPVPLSEGQLKVVSLQIKGHYSDYTHFLAYLNMMHSLPLAIVDLKAKGKEFEAQIKIYGIA